ncbi:tRNA glutamyl-Q(34) synthetase GluQRS [Shouchella clausii]|uniref:tRNA glutamyl-Q(34) synthetase GluQRS n=1 Tax=Shouchella TaxID=2893057 RepID=UPI0004E7BA96|nr:MULTISPECIES: tRNA glutamyl-Q(34) synthetase GluQRS [Shouchella]ALA52631.1 glutamyl-Q-tRNA synthetase [Shouchella clausii]MBU3233202.1 tRNA glutamyl-Q(34) synthetase GluQRS [Shouchella clausii]MBU3266175.1 tRNA glutamyl-Q(34) synthetase GluQRS [Shouchella clausii]MBU3509144.1 tRNA glutamyl-Q(34) synthetase GluQRS [Shouchella clausii]MBU3536401.1 tRNA glutamyl-Q(34) synthetase GluQRS [Shouchella clausii]
MNQLRGRFAPTPSGELHLGNLYVALLSWLQVRQGGGQFILRMEDIDRPRSRNELVGPMMDDLHWLGLDWDEGPDQGGENGPYYQSKRLHLYEEALHNLQQQQLLYHCYCSRAELQAVASAPHGVASEGQAYPGTCKKLTAAERAAKAAKKTPSLRFAVDKGPTAEKMDVEMEKLLRRGGDFVVQRADGIISYQLAVVVDDALMGITDVLRGQDLYDSTPRQLLLYAALGYTAPRFVHVPLLYGPDGRRLAKRHRDLSLAAIRANGCRPEDIVGLLAALSGLIEHPEPLTAAELIPEFRLEKLTTEPILLDTHLLQLLN